VTRAGCLLGIDTLEAIELERHGNYLEAKKRYEEAMKIYRETGSKLSLSNEYDNLDRIVLYLGDLAGRTQALRGGAGDL
jgi:hypothetical protein